MKLTAQIRDSEESHRLKVLLFLYIIKYIYFKYYKIFKGVGKQFK